MAHVYMIRHGKPASAWGSDFDPDPGLDSLGMDQAAAVRDVLLAIPEPFRPKAVVSSPLRRCRETAAPFAHALGVEIEVDPAFGEIPTPRTLPESERAAWLRTAFAGRWDAVVGDLDYDRWRRSVAEALFAHPGCAVFSHFVAINAAVSVVQGDPRVLNFQPDHASVTRFSLEDGRLSLIELGREATTGIL